MIRIVKMRVGYCYNYNIIDLAEIQYFLHRPEYIYHIEIPANTTATIILMNGMKQEVPAGKYEF